MNLGSLTSNPILHAPALNLSGRTSLFTVTSVPFLQTRKIFKLLALFVPSLNLDLDSIPPFFLSDLSYN